MFNFSQKIQVFQSLLPQQKTAISQSLLYPQTCKNPKMVQGGIGIVGGETQGWDTTLGCSQGLELYSVRKRREVDYVSKQWIEVVIDFLHHRRSCGSSLTSDGTRLLSYGVEVGRWSTTEAGKEVIVLPDVAGKYSRTTTRHQNTLGSMAQAQKVLVRRETEGQ